MRTLAARMLVGDERFDSEEIHRLYESDDYPLGRRARILAQATFFHHFTLNDAIMRALREEKYLVPTPIQRQTIPTVKPTGARARGLS